MCKDAQVGTGSGSLRNKGSSELVNRLKDKGEMPWRWLEGGKCPKTKGSIVPNKELRCHYTCCGRSLSGRRSEKTAQMF